MLDATGADDCVLVAHCAAAGAALLLAADHAERVRGAVFMSPALPITPPAPERTGFAFDEELRRYEGWAKANSHYWARDFRGYLEFFFGALLPGAALDQAARGRGRLGARDDAGDARASRSTRRASTARRCHELLGRLRCPLLVTQGDEDHLIPADRSEGSPS